jgi:hypothetical protein
MNLLGDLWDAYFDFRFESQVESSVCDAVQAIIAFLIDKASLNLDASSFVGRRDDWNVIEVYCGLIERDFGSEARRLRESLSLFRLEDDGKPWYKAFERPPGTRGVQRPRHASSLPGRLSDCNEEPSRVCTVWDHQKSRRSSSPFPVERLIRYQIPHQEVLSMSSSEGPFFTV